MKKCPFCAEEIQDEAIICRFCGRDLPVVEKVEAEKELPTISEIPSQTVSSETSKDIKIVVGLVIACLALLTFYYFMIRQPSSQQVFVTPPTVGAVSFVMPKGDFEMSWNTYNSQYDSTGSILTIRKQGSKYTMTQKFSDGSGGTVPLSVKVVNGEERLYDKRFDDYYGDYMFIEKNGYLSFYDKQGFIYTVPPLR